MLALLLITLAVIGLSVFAILVFRYVYVKESKSRSVLINLSILALSTVYILIALEAIAYKFIDQPDGFGHTKASSRWDKEYWKPINSLGYRDAEHSVLDDKHVIFVVGDSFVAGHGVENYEDRFSNVLASKLDEGWEVVTIAQPNWHTGDEYDAFVSYPHEPDVIILSYFVNDIEGAAQKAGIPRPRLIKPPPALIEPVVRRSYLVNFLYWRAYRITFAQEMREAYFDYLYNAYSSDAIWEIHKEEILKIVDFTKKRDIKLFVVIFPNLADIDGSETFTSKVMNLLAKRGVEVINLGDKFAGRKTKELVVNTVDAHPNEQIHKEVGNLLYNHLFPN